MADGTIINHSFSDGGRIGTSSGSPAGQEALTCWIDHKTESSERWKTNSLTKKPRKFVHLFKPLVHQTVDHGESETLRDTLAKLDHVSDMILEYGLDEPPDKSAIENARELIREIYAIHAASYHVSPTERQGVAINAPMRKGGAVSIECAPNDVVYCFVCIDGNRRRAKFYQTEGLPDPFIKTALQDLAKG